MKNVQPALLLLCLVFALASVASTQVVIRDIPRADNESWKEWLLTRDGETYLEKRENWIEVCEGTAEVCEEGLRRIDLEAELEFELWLDPPVVEPPFLEKIH